MRLLLLAAGAALLGCAGAPAESTAAPLAGAAKRRGVYTTSQGGNHALFRFEEDVPAAEVAAEAMGATFADRKGGPRVQRLNAAQDVAPQDRIPTDVVLKDGSSPERTYEGGLHHWDEPIVHTWDGVLSPEECAEIIETARPGLKRANVTDDGRGHTSAGRTNDNSWLVHDFSDLTWTVVQRIAGMVGLPSTHAESMQVIHYEAGEQYTNHYDAYEHGTVQGDKVLRDGGNRVITALVYLNDVPHGGETELVNIGLKVAPSTGRMLVFHDCYNRCAQTDRNEESPGLRDAWPCCAQVGHETPGLLPRGSSTHVGREVGLQSLVPRSADTGRRVCGAIEAVPGGQGAALRAGSDDAHCQGQPQCHRPQRVRWAEAAGCRAHRRGERRGTPCPITSSRILLCLDKNSFPFARCRTRPCTRQPRRAKAECWWCGS